LTSRSTGHGATPQAVTQTVPPVGFSAKQFKTDAYQQASASALSPPICQIAELTDGLIKAVSSVYEILQKDAEVSASTEQPSTEMKDETEKGGTDADERNETMEGEMGDGQATYDTMHMLQGEFLGYLW
jgi:hypothetical protein